jgi:glycosyltransferase involved in cell wall biosynthesis
MRVLMISKACVVGAYQRKLEEIAACPGIELTLAVPAAWRDERGVLRLERAHTHGYTLVVEPLIFNGSFHFHFYPRLGRLLADLKPDVVHVDEEPYNFATWHAFRLARRYGSKLLFFSWQNLLRHYPFPFNYFEREVLRSAQAAIVGNQEAVDVWRAKGYTGPISVIPQFGVDPEIFKPKLSFEVKTKDERRRTNDELPPSSVVRPSSFIIGYAGRLVHPKGLDLLLRAVAQLPPTARVHLVGSGPERVRLEHLAMELGLQDRLRIEALIPSTQMPNYFAGLDCLVLPSRTQPNWKEQFGRVLIEAMACGVPVVGSTCGEIPNVIGDAGLTFAEEDVAALASHLRRLQASPAEREALAARGRARVLEHYTHRQIAHQTVSIYRSIAKSLSA